MRVHSESGASIFGLTLALVVLVLVFGGVVSVGFDRAGSLLDEMRVRGMIALSDREADGLVELDRSGSPNFISTLDEALAEVVNSRVLPYPYALCAALLWVDYADDGSYGVTTAGAQSCSFDILNEVKTNYIPHVISLSSDLRRNKKHSGHLVVAAYSLLEPGIVAVSTQNAEATGSRSYSSTPPPGGNQCVCGTVGTLPNGDACDCSPGCGFGCNPDVVPSGLGGCDTPPAGSGTGGYETDDGSGGLPCCHPHPAGHCSDGGGGGDVGGPHQSGG